MGQQIQQLQAGRVGMQAAQQPVGGDQVSQGAAAFPQGVQPAGTGLQQSSAQVQPNMGQMYMTLPDLQNYVDSQSTRIVYEKKPDDHQ